MQTRSFVHRFFPAFVPAATAMAVTCLAPAEGPAADWTRFRGPNGSGVSPDGQELREKFSETESLKWKAELPGPGTSSPIVIGDKVIVTCWTGYGTDRANPGKQEDLQRNVVCLNRADGSVLWQHAEPAILPEDQYGGMFAEHGYTSHTPVTDGENVYVFFGKTGAIGLKLSDGAKLWQTRLGDGLEQRGWGSASSPVLYKELLIIPALIEGNSIAALNKNTGEVVWKQDAPGYDGTWDTPIIVEVDSDRTDIVLAVPGEVWGLNPENGKLRWYCEIPGLDSARSSVIAHDGAIFAMSGRGGGCVAIKSGGKGDVSQSHLLWQNERDNSGIASPLLLDGRLYLVAGKVVTVLNAETGERLDQVRLRGTAAPASESQGRPDNPVARKGRPEGQPDAGSPPGRGRGGAPGGPPAGGPPAGGPGRGAPGGGFGGGGFGGGGYGGGGFGGQDYSSPVAAGDKMIYTSRSGDVFVVKVGDKVEQIAANQFASDRSDYSATPAIADGELFIRSAKAIYCVKAK